MAEKMKIPELKIQIPGIRDLANNAPARSLMGTLPFLSQDRTAWIEGKANILDLDKFRRGPAIWLVSDTTEHI